ncbi:MAG: WD40 repeat domain-containing protein [Candidatus Bipolaricaulota bacterium]
MVLGAHLAPSAVAVADPVQPEHTLQGHRGTVASVVFSPDGTFLASGGGDTEVLLWRVPGS